MLCSCCISEEEEDEERDTFGVKVQNRQHDRNGASPSFYDDPSQFPTLCIVNTVWTLPSAQEVR